MPEFNVVDFDREKHGPYLFDAFVKTTLGSGFPWNAVADGGLLADLKRILAGPGCVAKVAVLDDAYLGVVVCRPAENEVVWAYTTYAYRQKFGVMTTLMRECGVTRRRPVGVRYWTRASERIHIDHGWEIYHKVTG